MALLNPPEILPDIAHAIHRRLIQRGDSENEAQLTDAFIEVKSGAEHFEKTLHALIDIAILRRADGVISVVKPKVPLIDSILEAVRTVDPGEIWAQSSSSDGLSQVGALDLARALAWFMHQNLYEMSGRWDPPSGINELQLDQFQRAAVLANDTRWQSFTRWALYLGCALPLYVGNQVRILPDPTRAVRDFLRERKEEVVAIEGFVSGIAAKMPFLDRGTLFEAMAGRLAAPTGPNRLSFALSFALLRLERDKTLKLRDDADAPKLALQHGLRTRTVSHISLGI